ncbi:TetR/AcrR family transcriptional regulator [Streptomyces shenzhenensis]|uniref:TetR family transcriptional regulator n=1 Tax=Streptomyces shenzhenensis TaxID=943815 RepID=A0A3M0I6C3_9ACTN|nr:TetR/AcrR family transcriptional regulator [Streptomyces shenzhenensis]RMB83730.1 TetR family transcriptional regulator [Streptomyces shenzhenensis]
MPGNEQHPAGHRPSGRPAPEHEQEVDGEQALDVRTRRTRARLREAVVRLASEGPVEDVSVTDLVRAARINRTTFYKHAESPAAVLEQVLYADLDRVRADWLADAAAAELPVREIWEHASGALVDHLERHDALYTAGLVGRRSAALHHLLVDHFTASVHALLDRDPGLLPEGEGSAAWRADAHSRFVAHGEAGLVEAWLTLPAPRDRRLFISAAASALPSWLAVRPHQD